MKWIPDKLLGKSLKVEDVCRRTSQLWLMKTPYNIQYPFRNSILMGYL